MLPGCQKGRKTDRRQNDFSAYLSKQKLFRMSTGCQKDRKTGRQTDRKTDRKTDRSQKEKHIITKLTDSYFLYGMTLHLP